MALSVEPEDAEGDAYGKTVRELQENVRIVRNKVYGTLHYVTGYTGFDGTTPDNQKGNFLAMKVEAPEDAEVKFKLIGGKGTEKTLPPDDNQIIWKITSTTQKPHIEITKGGVTESVDYDLSKLVLEQPSD